MTCGSARLQRLDGSEKTSDMFFQQSDRAEERRPPAWIGAGIGFPARRAELFLRAPEHAPRLAQTLHFGELVDGHPADACKNHAAH